MGKLKLTVDSLDGVDKALHGLYEERDGKFHLAVEDLPDVAGINAALDKERRRSKELTDSLKPWQGLGIELDEVKKLAETREAIEREKANLGKTKDQQYAELQKSFEQKLTPLQKQIETLEKERAQARQDLEMHRVKGALRSAAITAKVKPEFFDDVEMRANQFRFIEGQVIAVGSDGEPLRSQKDARNNLLPDEWMEGMAKAKPGWFEGSSGGGAGGGQMGARAGTVSRDDPMAIGANLDKIAKGQVVVQ
jgi:DNA-binding transcriptional MerR regulator